MDRRVVELRERMTAETAAESGPGTEVALVSDVDIEGVPARFYLPHERGEHAVAVYLHGGGWVAGGLDTHDPVCRYLAALSGVAVVAVGYRLAPESPFPAALEDIDRVVAWLRRDGAEYGLDATRMAVVGDSCGGTLAAATARRWRDRGLPFASQVLVYPPIDPAAPRGGPAGAGFTAEEMAFFWDQYAPAGVDRAHPDVTPSAADLTGLPPTLVITAEDDIVRDEAEAYARALADAGVPAVAVRYQGQEHGFLRRLVVLDAARTAVTQIAATLRAELA